MCSAEGFVGWALLILVSVFLPDSISGQSGADCSSAIPVTPVYFDITSWAPVGLHAATGASDCASTVNKETWIVFTASAANDQILVRANSAQSDIALELWSTCSDVAPIQCFDNYGIGQIERAVHGSLIVGHEYLIRIMDQGTGAATQAEIQIKTFLDGGLNPSYCDVFHYQLSNSLYAERDDLGQLYTGDPVNVTAYRFRFTNVNTGASGIYAHINLEPYLQLVNVPIVEHGNVYDVAVQHRIQTQSNGQTINIWSEFGSTCQIGIDSILPVTQLTASLCPSMVDLDLDDWVGATSILGADEYQFRFSGIDDTLTKTISTYGMSLSTIGGGSSGLQYGSSLYHVDVRLRIGSQWSEYGPKCVLSMVAHHEPITIRTDYCNVTRVIGLPNFILSEIVSGAESYQFSLTPLQSGVGGLIELTSGPALAFHQLQNEYLPGQYSVKVRALAGGYWGDFSESCVITLEEGPVAPPSDEELWHAVQPFEDVQIIASDRQIYIHLPKEVERLRATLIDLYGRHIAERSFHSVSPSDPLIWSVKEMSRGNSYFIILDVNGELLRKSFAY